MTLDLEQFVDKKVIVTLNNDQVIETTICKQEKPYSVTYPYYYEYYDEVGNYSVVRTYNESGIYDIGNFNSAYNIKSIQLKNQPMTKLSDKAFDNLCNALTSDVILYIDKDSRYVHFMQEVIPDALSQLMGPLDDDLKCELSMAIMDRMALKQTNL